MPLRGVRQLPAMPPPRVARPPPTTVCPFPVPPAVADLKFGVGDGKLRYYLFNWRVAREIPPNQVGLVML